MTDQPRLFADTWPWVPEPEKPSRPRCYRCGNPGLSDPYDPEICWCASCGETTPRLSPEREALLRAEANAQDRRKRGH